MSKKIIPCFYLKNQKFVKSFLDNTVIAENPIDYIVPIASSGADELIIFDLSNNDDEHEANLLTIREIGRKVDIPIIGAGNVKRVEDVKKLIYAGCHKVALNMKKDSNIDMTEEVSKRFSKDKIIACCDCEEQILNNIELIRDYTDCVLLLNGNLSDSYKDIDLIIIDETEEIDNVVMLLNKENVSAISGKLVNDNGEALLSLKKELKDKKIDINTFESKYKWSDFKKNSDGHVTVVVQDYKTDEVLMVAYMDEEAFDNTINTGVMTYHSRSRNEMWVKGATSGHYQYVKELIADCDMDTILAKVVQIGSACHTGSRSCFFNEVVKKDYSSTNPLRVFESVYDVIMDRKINPKEGSYTNYLFDKGIDKILKKVGEEATEIVIAAKNPDKEEVKYEMADFLYHAMVLMAECNLTWEDITKELANR